MEKKYCITFRRLETQGWLKKEHWVNHYYTVIAHRAHTAEQNFWKWAVKEDGRIELFNIYVIYRKKGE